MTISLIHPSVRPDRVDKILNAWILSANQPASLEYILAHHGSQYFDPPPGVVRIVNDGPNHPTRNGRSSFVDNVNLAASRAKGDILACIADDLYPCRDWDKLILEALPDPSTEAILAVDDGPGWDALIRHPIMTRARYEQQGWFFCPDYTGIFSDNDLHRKAKIDGVRIAAPQIQYRHEHPIYGYPSDKWYERGGSESEFNAGAAILRRRMEAGFPHAKH